MMEEPGVFPSTAERIFISGYINEADSLLAYLESSLFFRWMHKPLMMMYDSVLCCYDADYDTTFLGAYLDMLRKCHEKSSLLGEMCEAKRRLISSGDPVVPNGAILQEKIDSLEEIKGISNRMRGIAENRLENGSHRYSILYQDSLSLFMQLRGAYSRSVESIDEFFAAQRR